MIALQGKVSASDMAKLTEREAHFRVPSQPRLVRGLVLVEDGDVLIVDGTEERQVLRGKGVRTLLPRLLPLLDGSSSTRQMARTLPGVPDEAVRAAVALLYSRGIVEEGEANDADDVQAPTDVSAFFHRHVDVTRVHRQGEDALRALTSCRVLVLGELSAGSALAEELKLLGVARAERAPSRALGNLPVDAIDFAVVLVARGSALGQLQDLLAALRASRVPLLLSSLVGSVVRIGPRFEPDDHVCTDCLPAIAGLGPSEEVPGSWRLRYWASLVAAEVAVQASRLWKPAATRAAVRFDLENWTTTSGLPKIATTSAGFDVDAWSGAAIAPLYERSVLEHSKQSVPKDRQVHYRVAQRQLRWPQTRFPSYPRVALPLEAPSEVAGAAQHGVLLGSLAEVVRRGVGLRSHGDQLREGPSRWAPSAGNLGSPQVYIVVREVIGLEPAVHYYDPLEDALITVAPAPTAKLIANALSGSCNDGEPTHCPCWLVLTAALGRLRAKYGPVGYRLAHLDSGVACAQLELAARAVGLRCWEPLLWPDSLIAQELGFGECEPVTAVIAFAPGSHAP